MELLYLDERSFFAAVQHNGRICNHFSHFDRGMAHKVTQTLALTAILMALQATAKAQDAFSLRIGSVTLQVQFYGKIPDSFALRIDPPPSPRQVRPLPMPAVPPQQPPPAPKERQALPVLPEPPVSPVPPKWKELHKAPPEESQNVPNKPSKPYIQR